MNFLFLFYQIFFNFFNFFFWKKKFSGWCTDYLHHHSVKVPVAIHSITQGKRSYDNNNKCSWLSSRGQFVFEWQCLLIVLCSCRLLVFIFPFFFRLLNWDFEEIMIKNSWLQCGIWLAKKGIRETWQPQINK